MDKMTPEENARIEKIMAERKGQINEIHENLRAVHGETFARYVYFHTMMHQVIRSIDGAVTPPTDHEMELLREDDGNADKIRDMYMGRVQAYCHHAIHTLHHMNEQFATAIGMDPKRAEEACQMSSRIADLCEAKIERKEG